MSTKHLRRIIIMGAVILAGLMVVQVYWFRKAFDSEQRELDHRVQVALMRVADSVSTSAEVRKLSSNLFFVAAEANVTGEAIDSLLKSEFSKRNIFLNYELGVYNAEDDTLVYGQYIEATRKTRLEQAQSSVVQTTEARNFGVYFPGKDGYLIAQLDIWIFSTLALLLMMGFFAWSIATLLRERKFSELKNDFINNMTHEFKTPITNISIAAEVLKKKLPRDTGLEAYINILQKENTKLKNKVESVLLGSSAGKQDRTSFEQVDVHQLIAECADAFQLKMRERNGILQLQLDASNNIVLGDRDLLSQAISNVIDNAEKYSPAQPQIFVRTVDGENAIRIEIRDRGVGIPANLQMRVFEKFFRVRQGDIHTVKGFGLGLNFVRDVIKSHRGKVSLFSAPGEGTEIKIILPKG